MGVSDRVAGVAPAVVALLCLQEVSAVRQFVILEAVLALCAAAGVLGSSTLARGGLLLARDDRDALILALVLLQL